MAYLKLCILIKLNPLISDGGILRVHNGMRNHPYDSFLPFLTFALYLAWQSCRSPERQNWLTRLTGHVLYCSFCERADEDDIKADTL